jgi:hypothetical protein
MGLAPGGPGIREERDLLASCPTPSAFRRIPFPVPQALSLRARAARALAPTGCGTRTRVSQVLLHVNRYHQTVPCGGVPLSRR